VADVVAMLDVVVGREADHKIVGADVILPYSEVDPL
jgi:hypothetical protein